MCALRALIDAPVGIVQARGMPYGLRNIVQGSKGPVRFPYMANVITKNPASPFIKLPASLQAP